MQKAVTVASNNMKLKYAHKKMNNALEEISLRAQKSAII